MYWKQVGLFPNVIAVQHSLSFEKQRAALAQTLCFVMQWAESRCKANYNHLKRGPPLKKSTGNRVWFKCQVNYRVSSMAHQVVVKWSQVRTHLGWCKLMFIQRLWICFVAPGEFWSQTEAELPRKHFSRPHPIKQMNGFLFFHSYSRTLNHCSHCAQRGKYDQYSFTELDS